jgi:hypothetical protein
LEQCGECGTQSTSALIILATHWECARVNRPLDGSLCLEVFGKLKLVICAHRSRTCPGSVFCAPGRPGSHPDFGPTSGTIDVQRRASASNRARSTLAGVAWLRRPYEGDPLLSDCIFNDPRPRAMHSCLNARLRGFRDSNHVGRFGRVSNAPLPQHLKYGTPYRRFAHATGRGGAVAWAKLRSSAQSRSPCQAILPILR